MIFLFLTVQATIAVNCLLVVPNDPLSEKGLTTPYILQGCSMATAKEETFVEAVIFNPVLNKLFVYHPLVIDEGTDVAIAPTELEAFEAGTIVGIWFASNADSFELIGEGKEEGNCVNGIKDELGVNRFEDLSFCNAKELFEAASGIVQETLGTANDGQPCLTVRDWSIVDQEQADNVNTQYLLLTNDNTTAQSTQKNREKLTEDGIPFKELISGLDNRLIVIMDDALDCTTPRIDSLDDIGNTFECLAVNELFAAANQLNPALVPGINPLIFRPDDPDLQQELVVAYREGVFQDVDADSTGLEYCLKLAEFAPARYLSMQDIIRDIPSPDLKAADTLLNFLCSRHEKTFSEKQDKGLECNIITGLDPPVFGLKDDKGVAIACTIGGVTIPEELSVQAQADIEAKLAKALDATGSAGKVVISGTSQKDCNKNPRRRRR